MIKFKLKFEHLISLYLNSNSKWHTSRLKFALSYLSSPLHLLNLEREVPIQILHGMTTVLRHAVQKDIMKSETIVLNVQHHYSLTQSMANANHVHKGIYLIRLLTDVNARFPVLLQDPLIRQTTNVNVQLIKKALEEFGIQKIMFVIVQLISHYGMVNIVLYAQQELSMTQVKDNAITVQKDLFEILPVTIACQDFEIMIRFIERKNGIEYFFIINKL
jgi:hypothetical protein